MISILVHDKGHLSAHELREMTHNETPWQEAWNNTEDRTITNNMIATYFSPQFWASDEECLNST